MMNSRHGPAAHRDNSMSCSFLRGTQMTQNLNQMNRVSAYWHVTELLIRGWNLRNESLDFLDAEKHLSVNQCGCEFCFLEKYHNTNTEQIMSLFLFYNFYMKLRPKLKKQEFRIRKKENNTVLVIFPPFLLFISMFIST